MSSLKTNNTAPAANEFEFSVFGPGTGECVVIHYGNNQWFIIDSFRENDEPIAKSYLESIGVNIHTDVKHILATHFDDDHCDGMHELLANCDEAKFHCSNSLVCKEFFECVVKNSKLRLVATKHGLKEFRDILDLLERTSPIPKRCRSKYGPNYIQAGKTLELAANVSFLGLSPSSQAINDAARAFSDEYLELAGPVTKLPSNWFNMNSVAAVFETPKINILLGADLEIGGNEFVGWRGVIADDSLRKPLSEIFKVPHHGSQGADFQPVWDRLLIKHPVVSLTSKAQSSLPRPEDVVRLKNRTNNNVAITNPRYIHRPKKHGAANRRMNLITRSRRSVRKELGQICVRFEIGTNQYTIQTFGAARQLN